MVRDYGLWDTETSDEFGRRQADAFRREVAASPAPHVARFDAARSSVAELDTLRGLMTEPPDFLGQSLAALETSSREYESLGSLIGQPPDYTAAARQRLDAFGFPESAAETTRALGRTTVPLPEVAEAPPAAPEAQVALGMGESEAEATLGALAATAARQMPGPVRYGVEPVVRGAALAGPRTVESLAGSARRLPEELPRIVGRSLAVAGTPTMTLPGMEAEPALRSQRTAEQMMTPEASVDLVQTAGDVANLWPTPVNQLANLGFEGARAALGEAGVSGPIQDLAALGAVVAGPAGLQAGVRLAGRAGEALVRAGEALPEGRLAAAVVEPIQRPPFLPDLTRGPTASGVLRAAAGAPTRAEEIGGTAGMLGGAAGGVLTAEEDATWQERLSRGLVGAVTGAGAGRGAVRLPGQVRALAEAAGEARRIVPPEVARGLGPVWVPHIPLHPDQQISRELLEHYNPGVGLTPEGMALDVNRWQRSEQAGAEALRGGVFYKPGRPELSPYRPDAGGVMGDVGGEVPVAGPTLFRRPLFVMGEYVAEQARQVLPMGASARLSEQLYEGLQQLAETARRDPAGPSMLNGGFGPGAQAPRAWTEALAAWGVPDAAAAAQRIAELAPNRFEAVTALTEQVVAAQARRQGYDAVVGLGVGGNNSRISEILDLREATYPTPEGGFTLRPEFRPGAPARGGGAAPLGIIYGTGGEVISRAEPLPPRSPVLGPTGEPPRGRPTAPFAAGPVLRGTLPEAAATGEMQRALFAAEAEAARATGRAAEGLRAAVANPDPTATDKALALATSWALSAPSTLLVNLFGGLAENLNRPVLEVLAGRPREAITDVTAMGAAFSKAWAAAGQAFLEGRGVQTTQRAIETGRPEAFPGRAGVLATPALRLLGATDEFVKTIASAGALAVAKRRGLDDLDALQFAENAARRAVFLPEGGRSPLHRLLQEWRQHAHSDNPLERIWGLAGFAITPFYQVPEEILKRGGRMLISPVVDPIIAVRALAKRDPDAAREAFARMLLNGTIATVAVNQALAGNLTGNGPRDAGERRAMEQARGPEGNPLWQRNSARLAGRWYAYDQLGPVGVPLAAMATFVEDFAETGRLPGKASRDQLARAAGDSGKAILDQSYLRNLAGIITAWEEGRLPSELARTLGSAASLPIPGVVARAAAATDPYQREAVTPLDRLLVKIPGLRQRVPVKVGETGEPLRQYADLLSAVSPLRTQAPGPGTEAGTRLAALYQHETEQVDRALAALRANASYGRLTPEQRTRAEERTVSRISSQYAARRKTLRESTTARAATAARAATGTTSP